MLSWILYKIHMLTRGGEMNQTEQTQPGGEQPAQHVDRHTLLELLIDERNRALYDALVTTTHHAGQKSLSYIDGVVSSRITKRGDYHYFDMRRWDRDRRRAEIYKIRARYIPDGLAVNSAVGCYGTVYTDSGGRRRRDAEFIYIKNGESAVERIFEAFYLLKAILT